MGIFNKLKEPIFLKENCDAEEQINNLKAFLETATGNNRERIEQDIRNINAGLFGENQIIFELKNSHMPMYILRDLYLKHGELSAQIDFLVITRKCTLVIECKNLYGDIEINKDGDFIRTIQCGRITKKEGIYSPITQNQRHLNIIKQIRLATKNNIITKALVEKKFSNNYKGIVVLANSKTVLKSDFAKDEIKKQVIRADQLISYIENINNSSKNESSSDADMKSQAEFFMAMNCEKTIDYSAKYLTLEQEEIGDNKRLLEVIEEPTTSVMTSNSSQEDVQICPKCGQTMVLRTATRGENQGNQFYGCSNYPKCRGIINLQK